MTATDPSSFKVEDASSYDPVAAAFDHFSERFTKPLAERLVSLAGLGLSQRIVDVGTWTGIVALEAARHVGPEGSVVGVDLSEGMLQAAEAKAARAGLAARLHFRRMDAEALQLGAGSCDAALSLFALLHFPDPRAALAEMRRVLRPGGRLAVGIGSGPPLLSMAALRRVPRGVLAAWRRLRGRELLAPHFLERLVGRHLPEPERPEQTALARKRHGRIRSLAALVRGAGFEDVKASWEGHAAVLETPEEFWELQRVYSSVARKRLAGAPAERVRALREEFLEASRHVLASGGRLVYRQAACFVIARRG